MALRNYSSTAAQTTLSAGVTAAATTLPVASTTGFPPAPFILSVDAGAAAQELVLVTAVGGTNLTVTRGYDSTVASAHDAGALVEHSHAAIEFREANSHVNATTNVHGLGVGSAAVGTTDTQTLTNKTVALGSNTISGTKAQFDAALTDGDFATLAGAETLTNKDLTSATNSFPAANPLGVLGYAQVTANQTGITSEVDLTGLSVAVTVGTNRRIRISYVGEHLSSASGDVTQVKIMEGTTELHNGAQHLGSGAGVSNIVTTSTVLTPTAGAHTYKMRALRAAGSGSITASANATRKSYILVEDIGAA
jgi:hypothetical protein